MFRLMLLSGWTLTHLYVFLRLSSLPWVRRRVSRKALLAAGTLLFATWFMRGAGASGGTFSHVVDLFTLNWLGLLFLMGSAFLAGDLLTGFGLLFRRWVPMIRTFSLFAGVALGGLALWQGTRPPEVTRYEVSLPGLPMELDGTTVAALSDTHLGDSLGAPWFSDVAERVRTLRPDMIVLLGDISEGRARPDGELIRILRGLDAPLGVYGVLGNHEFHGEGSRLMEDAGIRVLRDAHREAAPGLVVAGVDDLGTLRRRGGRPEDAIRKALRGRPAGAVIYLSHTPAFAEAAAAEGAGLMLSGHTHGGQLWPYGYILRLLNPLFAGRYDVDGMAVLVSRGTGTWGPRMRLWLRAPRISS
jgi:hypothetical protein